MTEHTIDDINVYFDYLDELRDSGETNMFWARLYLVKEFNLEEKEAWCILNAWMKTFKRDASSWDRAAKAFDEDLV